MSRPGFGYFSKITSDTNCDNLFLECSERAENHINRKSIIFYIEAIPKFFSQLRKKNFFFRVQIKIRIFFDQKSFEKWSAKIWQKISNLKSQRMFPAPTRYCEGTKTCSISRIFWILVRIRPFSPLWKCRYLEIYAISEIPYLRIVFD